MTVATQVKQTQAALMGVEATIRTYQLHHPNSDTRKLMEECNAGINAVLDTLSTRIREIEYEEHQFKGL